MRFKKAVKVFRRNAGMGHAVNDDRDPFAVALSGTKTAGKRDFGIQFSRGNFLLKAFHQLMRSL